ncbi:MAG: hypothetical protein K8R88_12995, partial [Armatimonadetes bacterium]|nr:hypothetical protein [Armatimonadota bacterium]
MNMIQNWKWIAALALVGSIAGCSGDGAAAGGGGGGGGVITRSVPGVTLGTKGVVSVVFLSGQDRRSRGVGSQIADINSIQLQNGPSDYIPSTDVVQLSPLSVQLDGYTINQRDIQVSLNGAASKSFTEYPLIIN